MNKVFNMTAILQLDNMAEIMYLVEILKTQEDSKLKDKIIRGLLANLGADEVENGLVS